MKLISLNVEGSKHWDLIDPFLDKELPDTLCLQEVFEIDAVRLAERLGMHHLFAPMMLRNPEFKEPELPELPFGVAMLSRIPFASTSTQEYHSTGNPLLPHGGKNMETRRASIRQVLLSAEVPFDGKIFSVATTHFTWTSNGLPDQYQEDDARALLEILSKMPGDIALCGDFNMPRHFNALYDLFAARYTDAIPASYDSSIDLSIHRSRNNPAAVVDLCKYMVDYLFLTPGYRAGNVRLLPGVSDHYAIVANLESITLPQGR